MLYFTCYLVQKIFYIMYNIVLDDEAQGILNKNIIIIIIIIYYYYIL